MKYQVKLTRRAKQDRERTYRWYAENYSPEFADRWWLGITNAIDSLAADPLRCPKAAETDRFSTDIQELLYGSRKNKHRILFVVIDDVVNVLHLRHSAQHELDENDI